MQATTQDNQATSGRIEGLLEQLTLEEKVSMLAGADTWRTVAVERLGIPSLKMSDGPNGARGDAFSGGVTAAAFPAGTVLASFDDGAPYLDATSRRFPRRPRRRGTARAGP